VVEGGFAMTLGWGIGLALNLWNVYAPAPTVGDVQREIQRMNHW
jgi:hypothetical protein